MLDQKKIGIRWISDQVVRGWTEVHNLNQFGRVCVAMGIGSFLLALWFLVGPDPAYILIGEMDSQQRKMYRAFGRPGVVLFWSAFGVAFVWVGLLFGKSRGK